MSITYLSTSDSFVFQEDIKGGKQIQKNWLDDSPKNIDPGKDKCTSKTGHSQWTKAYTYGSRNQICTTVGNPEHPALFSQPGLVVPNHQGDVTILLQNCSDVDMEILRCMAVGFLENVKNDTFK
jgi:hypothetical protein